MLKADVANVALCLLCFFLKPGEFQRYDQAVAAANHPNMEELTNGQLSNLLAYTLYGRGDGKI